MTTEIFLVAPSPGDLPSGPDFIALLERLLAAAPISALLLPRYAQSENAYKNLVKSVAPVAQAANCAVLIEGPPGLVRTLGVDGLHVTGGREELEAAIAALKPDMIVGCTATTPGDATTRDAAMTRGETGADYVMFGPLSGSIDAATRDMAHWWAQTMQIPSILSDPDAAPANPNAEGCEFFGLGQSLWRAADPLADFVALASALEQHD